MSDITSASREDLLGAAEELEAEAAYRERLQGCVSNALGAAKVGEQATKMRAAADAKPRS